MLKYSKSSIDITLPGCKAEFKPTAKTKLLETITVNNRLRGSWLREIPHKPVGVTKNFLSSSRNFCIMTNQKATGGRPEID